MRLPLKLRPWFLALLEEEREKARVQEKNGILKSISKKGQSNRKNVCFAYNRKKGCDRSACPYAHICQRCGEQHPYHKCPKVRRSDE